MGGLPAAAAGGRLEAAASTIRTRIALVYGGVFLVLGTALLATVNVASRAGTDSEARAIASSAVVVPPGYPVNGPFIARSSVGAPPSTN